jgi:hypothetical protein
MTQHKRLWFTVSIFAFFALGVGSYRYLTAVGPAEAAEQPVKAPRAGDLLPIRQVVLFNSGLGYFQREGEVDGNARVELSFPVGDINDLLKSLVLQDAKGKIGTVNYDSSDPIDKILRSFALDLTGNPTFGQILNQARGEKIEITRSEKKDGQITKIAGSIVGIELQKRLILPSPSGRGVGGEGREAAIEVEVLNLNTATGLTAIPMDQIVAVRFQNPVLENEFQRALQVLARSHDTQKKTVSVGFNGAGKRPVKVGYVLERPIWKTTYRLRIDAKDKVFLQGWALVENTSDDDWNDVRMVLVSGKPIAFRMNLYDPLYIPRPFVEPELFASLRPPVYSGAIEGDLKRLVMDIEQTQRAMPKAMEATRIKAIDVIVEKLGRELGQQKTVDAQTQSPRTSANDVTMGHQANQGKFKKLVADWGRLPPREKHRALEEFLSGLDPTTRDKFERLLEPMSEKRQEDALQRMEESTRKIAKDSDAKMGKAKDVGKAIADMNFREGIKSFATADEVGEYFQYTIDQKITLPRQKSAMLPILDQTIQGHKFSIYNETVHAKYPLLGLKLKNTSGQPLTQGPITVYDGGTFGGDTRILDLQPNEERLLSYALDQGTEVKIETKQTPSPDMFFKIGADSLSAKYDVRETKTYTLKNRSSHDREVLIEHPLRSEWKLVEPKKPAEQTRDLYRFQVSVPAGKTVSLDVVEDMPRVDSYAAAPQYGIAAGVEIKVAAAGDFRRLTGVKIIKGLVEPTYKTRETRAYFVQNLSEIDRSFTVDHVVRPGWVRLDDKNDPQAGPEVFRFKLKVAKGKTGEQTVREERTQAEKGTLLKGLPEPTIKEYLASSAVSADVKAALTKALGMQAKIADTQKQIADVEKQLTVLTADHTRVRENLKIIPMTSEHYKTFLEKFVAQDRQIEGHQKTVRDLNAVMQQQMRDYDQFVAKLDAE